MISYDALNRLVQVAEGLPVAQGGVPIPVEDYAYDGEGNRTASHLSAVYASNDHNQLLEDDTYTYAYDAKGNRVSRTAKGSGAIETYTYDSQNRLVGYASAQAATYAYDALDRRIAKTVDGVTEAFVYDPWSATSTTANDAILDFTNGTLTRRWLHGPQHDGESGLIYFRARHYDAGTGTFLQRDPIGFASGDLNLYAYVWNDPLNYKDPSGLATVDNSNLSARVLGMTLGLGIVACAASTDCVDAAGSASSAFSDSANDAGAGINAAIAAAANSIRAALDWIISESNGRRRNPGDGPGPGPGNGPGSQAGSGGTTAPPPPPGGPGDDGDLPPGRPSFITRVLGFDSGRFRVWQARRARCHQVAQAPGALLRGSGSPAMNAA